MYKEKFYLTPEVKCIQIHLEGSVLTGSNEMDFTSTGEDATLGEIFDPWN